MSIDYEKMKSFFEKVVRFASEKNASDIFINSDNYIAIKTDGVLHYLKSTWFEDKDVFSLLKIMVRPENYKEFIDTHEMNVMIDVHGVTYLRVNAYMQRNKPGVVMRLVPTSVPTIDDLNLPGSEHLKQLSMIKRGLIIVAGATGNGKSTTLAAMINRRNELARDHIITVEDPIEFMHISKQSVIIQREIGIDTKSYETALKNSLRQAPNVILIGEIRDKDTMQYAMHFAETGHLCLATLHATNAVHALDRISNFFPREHRIQLHQELASHLCCLIVQRLLPRSNAEGRIVAMEMMMNTPYIQKLIYDGDFSKIPDAMRRANIDDGVFTFDDCIFNLYEEDLISYEEAESYVDSNNDFRIRVKNESKRRLPPILRDNGEIFSVQSDEKLEHELLKTRHRKRKK